MLAPMIRTVSVITVALLVIATASVVAVGQGSRSVPAPELGKGPWINSAPLTMAGLRGRVVLVEFWTYGCWNCQNVIPTLRDWHARYQEAGLTIVGVHSPEFFWERNHDRVVAATRKFSILYPVVLDNDLAIWERYGVSAWPTTIVVDRRGLIRYRHVGEGAYATTEALLRRLLDEPA
jgi:thiol-disulfide isomerase/thioredoxin